MEFDDSKNVKYSLESISNLNEAIRNNFPHLFPADKSMTKSLSSVSRLVMLDRYAQKDLTLKTLAVNDVVIATIKEDPMFPTLGIATVLAIRGNGVKLKVDEEFWMQIDSFYEPKDGVITIDRSQISKPVELFFEQIARRVGSFISSEDYLYTSRFIEELQEFNFVPAGRILYGAGSRTETTFFNCYVMPFIADSRDGIANHRKEVMEIMSRGGGVGTNGSTLRPRDCEAVTVKGKSSGAVSWLNDLATLTHLIQQGGSRRGAQMIMLGTWHPDVLEFIISKMQNPAVLRWISQNFKNEKIRSLAKNKLKFKPLSEVQRKMFQQIIDSHNFGQDVDPEVLKEAKSKLEAGGTYEVNDPNFLTGSNISIAITDDFMTAVENDTTYDLRFPDIINFTKEQKRVYDLEWHEMGDVNVWARLNYPVKIYETIRARELWDLINFCATYSAEPGVFFIDVANRMTNATTYGQKIVCTNPCGEQPLAPYSVCNLGAINLNNFINRKTKEIQWNKLKNTVSIAVRFLDNVINLTPYFLEKNRNQAIGERRVGLGIMGYHDLLIWKGLRYGSQEANALTDQIFKFIASTAYKTSAKLSKEKGSFGYLKDLDKFLESGFMKEMPADVIDEIRKYKGIRNSHLLTVAPTGSTGTLVGVSTGLEPYFAFEYYRSGRLGKFMKIEQQIVADWKRLNNFKGNELPPHFVSAMELSPEEHVAVQVAIQRWVDSSISKTVNAPKGYTVKQVCKIYEDLYKKGAKGGTVYVDGSRDSQVLSLEGEVKKVVKEEKFDATLVTNLQKIHEVSELQANVPSNKLDRAIGIEVGNLCPVCKEGVIEKLGGCNSCTLCKAQLKCDI